MSKFFLIFHCLDKKFKYEKKTFFYIMKFKGEKNVQDYFKPFIHFFITCLHFVWLQTADNGKQPEKDPIPSYLALKHGFPVSWSADVITLRLKPPLSDTGKNITVQTAIQVQL